MPLRPFVAALALLVSAMSPAAPPRPVPEVAFFSEALPPLLASYRAMLDTLDYCSRTPTGACGEGHAMPPSVIADMHYFLDRITTFPTTRSPPSRALQKQLESPTEAEPAFASMRDQYESKLRDYDMEFLGHFGALLHLCTKARERSDKIDLQYEGIRQLAVDRYWAVLPQDRQRLTGAIDRIAVETIQKFGSLSKERCTVMLALGKKLNAVYWRRLKPYAADDWSGVTYGDRLGESLFFTWTIALELEAHVRPDVLKEVDAREARSKP